MNMSLYRNVDKIVNRQNVGVWFDDISFSSQEEFDKIYYHNAAFREYINKRHKAICEMNFGFTIPKPKKTWQQILKHHFKTTMLFSLMGLGIYGMPMFNDTKELQYTIMIGLFCLIVYTWNFCNKSYSGTWNKSKPSVPNSVPVNEDSQDNDDSQQ